MMVKTRQIQQILRENDLLKAQLLLKEEQLLRKNERILYLAPAVWSAFGEEIARLREASIVIV